MKQPFGLILAGGQASRMGGGDKGRLMLGDQSLFARVIDRIAPQVERLALNANGPASRFADLGLPVVPDLISGFAGPLAGISAGLDWAAREGAETLVTVAADTPFFPEDLVPVLLRTSEDMPQPLALAATRAQDRLIRHPTFGIWPVALQEDLQSALHAGLRKIVLWTEQHAARDAVFPSGELDPFFNINTPEDLLAAEAML